MQQLGKWHQTKNGLLAFGVIELVLGYVGSSLALDTGSLFVYGLTLLLLIGALRNFAKLIGKFLHGSKHKTSKA